jgi:hypothetical protein
MPDFGDRRVMACSPSDLKRWLAELCGASSHSVFPGSTAVGAVNIDAQGLTLSLRWQVLEPRRIALLTMDQLEVEFSYPADQADAARAWIARFDQHTQRGGG